MSSDQIQRLIELLYTASADASMANRSRLSGG